MTDLQANTIARAIRFLGLCMVNCMVYYVWSYKGCALRDGQKLIDKATEGARAL